MLTCKTVSPQKAVNYFLQGYYLEGTSRWLGKGAEKLGLQGPVNNKEVFRNIAEGFSPDRSQQLSGKNISLEKRRAAIDCTFSAPKSVSLQALVAGDERLLTAHTKAVESVLAFAQERYSHTRVRNGDERNIIKTGNLVVAQFDHIETRELDPHLHTHALVMNMTQLQNGEWYSHLNEAVYTNKKFLGMAYQHQLAMEVQKLGYEVEWHAHGQFDIKGYTKEQLEDFSKRRQQILATVGPHSSWAEREKAWDATRKRKEKIKPVELKAKWLEEAAALDITFISPGMPRLEQQPEPVNFKSLDDAIAHCSERTVAFRQEELEQFMLSEGLTRDVSHLEPSIREHPELICIPEQNGVRFTTQAALQRELATISLMQQGQGAVAAINNSQTVEEDLEKTTLNEGQQQAVLIAVTTPDQLIAWQGVAGAGKTYALKELQRIASSYNIKGFAPSAEAAKVLESELKIEANTVARHLICEQPEEIQPDQLWIVDEAGLLSAKDAYALLQRAKLEQARVLLVGDTKQLSAVEAGNPFKSLQQAGMTTAYLNESQRQRDAPELKLAVDLIASGRIEAGFAQLEARKCVKTVTKETKVKEIVQEYMQAELAKRLATLVLAGTNAERLEINLAIREALKLEGSLGTEAPGTKLKTKDLTSVEKDFTRHFAVGDVVMPLRNYKRRGLVKGELYEVIGKSTDHLKLKGSDGTTLEVDTGFKKAVYERQQIEIAVGDRLRWTKNDRKLGRRNGQEFTVTAIEGNNAQLQYLDGSHSETIDLRKSQHLDYSMVSTIYSSQGKTAERVLIAADHTIGKESFYVSVSRAKSELKLYTEDRNKLLKLACETKAKETVLEALRQQVKKQVAAESLAVHGETGERSFTTEKPQSKRESSSITPGAEVRSTVAPPLRRSNTNQSPTPNVPFRSTVTSPIKSGDEKRRRAVSNQSSQQPPVKRSTEKQTDMAAIMKAASRQMPNPPDWLATGKRIHCKDQGWGEVEAVLGARLIVKLDTGKQAQILEWHQAIESRSVVPEPTEAFWIPDHPGVTPFQLDPAHWHELTESSVIHPEIAALNFKSLRYDMVEQAHEAWEHLFYSDKLERSNTGRLPAGILNRFAHLDDGGWWCSAGVDPQCFKDLQLGKKPDEKLWGCCKPNSPRVDAENPDKVIKYEHPLKTDLSVFLLKVPEQIAERIYRLAGVEPSAEDRASGFWYCVWKHNIPITITEGAKKAASLLSQGHAAIGLPGIYAGYRSKDEHGYDIVPRLHSELAVFATPEREITFCFDYETRFKTKRNIAIAISRTGTLLEQQGAKVSVVSLLGPEKGVDDLVKAQGPLAYEKQATTALHLQTWSKQGRQQFTPVSSSSQRPIPKVERIQSGSAHKVGQTSSLVEPSSTVTASQEQSNERSRQLNAANHDNQGNISTRTDSGESRVNAGDFPRTVTNKHRLETGVEGLSDAIRGAVELEATERIAGAIARVSASLRDFQPSTRRNSNIRSALERLHQGIREQHHRTNELTAGLTAAVNRLTEQIATESQGQIDSLSTAIRNHAETRVLAQQPRLVEALNRLQQRLAVVLEQKQRTRHQLKETLSTVQLPSSTEVIEQLQSAIANLDEQLCQQSVLLKQINSLDNQEFLQLRQQVRAYFEKSPQQPAEVQRQGLSQELSRLSTQIEQLWQQHSSSAKVVEQMQKNPFRLWNKKYDEALANLERTTKSIKHAVAQKDVCLQQLQEWAKLEQESQTWLSNPKTAQMQETASVLKLPQMQERLTQIRQELQQQAELRRSHSQSQPRRPGRGR